MIKKHFFNNFYYRLGILCYCHNIQEINKEQGICEDWKFCVIRNDKDFERLRNLDYEWLYKNAVDYKQLNIKNDRECVIPIQKIAIVDDFNVAKLVTLLEKHSRCQEYAANNARHLRFSEDIYKKAKKALHELKKSSKKNKTSSADCSLYIKYYQSRRCFLDAIKTCKDNKFLLRQVRREIHELCQKNKDLYKKVLEAQGLGE